MHEPTLGELPGDPKPKPTTDADIERAIECARAAVFFIASDALALNDEGRAVVVEDALDDALRALGCHRFAANGTTVKEDASTCRYEPGH